MEREMEKNDVIRNRRETYVRERDRRNRREKEGKEEDPCR